MADARFFLSSSLPFLCIYKVVSGLKQQKLYIWRKERPPHKLAVSIEQSSVVPPWQSSCTLQDTLRHSCTSITTVLPQMISQTIVKWRFFFFYRRGKNRPKAIKRLSKRYALLIASPLLI